MIRPTNVYKRDSNRFTSRKKVICPPWSVSFARIMVGFIIFTFLVLAFTPWQQTSQGVGKVIAFDPNYRVQKISSNVKGRIAKWIVRDGSHVKQGEPIVEVVDNDPQLISRLKVERDAIFQKYEAAKAATETSLLNLNRQKDLLEQGLTSQRKYEKSRIEYKKLLASEATAAANLAGAEVKLSRQQNQVVTAPRDGTILRIFHGSGSVFVKEGDALAEFVPDSLKPAVEIFVDGNDLPLIYPGRHVRLQFEGWPAVQFAGWPSVAIGTFGGVVQTVDSSASSKGKFRVIITPDSTNSWPDQKFLRQGARVYGWILLNSVRLGYEIWRQFNGFPAALDNPPENIKIIQKKYQEGKEKENKKYKDLYEEGK